MCQEIQTITDYSRKNHPVCTNYASLWDMLNDFYASNIEAAVKITIPFSDQMLTVTSADVR